MNAPAKRHDPRAQQSTVSGFSEHASFMEELRRDTAGFERLALQLKRLTGIHLPTNDKNRSLLASRLGFLLKHHELPGYGALHQLLAEGHAGAAQLFVEAMTTNTTQFFREAAHFAWLAKLLPELVRTRLSHGKNELRLWCAACSTGQEPYTMLMTLLESQTVLAPGNCKFLASDIDQVVLAKASQGLYSAAETETIPPVLRQKYFAARATATERVFQVNAAQRRMIQFAPVNLMHKPYPFQHGFDVIFCRNVLIYFEREVAIDVTARLMKALNPGGYLFLGHSESGLIKGPGFTSVASAVYRKDD